MLGWQSVRVTLGATPGRAESALWMFALVAGLLVAFLLAVVLLTIARRSRLFDRKKPGRPPHADVWRESARRRAEQDDTDHSDPRRDNEAFGPRPDENHNGERNGDDDDFQR